MSFRVLLGLAFCLVAGVGGEARCDDSLWLTIQQSGNASSDVERLQILKSLQTRPSLDDRFRADLNRMIDEIDKYAHSPRLDYFGGQILKKGSYDFGISDDSPLQPLALLYQARMQAWATMEYGGLWSQPEARRKQFDKIRPMFERLRAYFPDNKTVRMYLGEPVLPGRELKGFDGAPEWAVHQREALERLADIILWWIANRMQSSGEYGGGWGDDCEMWRWWTPILLGFEEPSIVDAQRRFSRALLGQEHMSGGYTSQMSDVEHTAEDSADALAPMMHLEPDNPEWSRRALRLAELMGGLWTGVNARGQVQFKSCYFTSERVDESPRRSFDSVYHPRAVQPALLYWQRTGDAELTRLFAGWLGTWVDATARAERGKPAGVIPSAIRWPQGDVGGEGPDWWNPEKDARDPLYVWPSAMGQMTNTLLLAYHMTQDNTFLAPLLSMAQVRLKSGETGNPEPGSADWCAQHIRLDDVALKYRLLYGGEEFDNLLAHNRSPYASFRLQGERQALCKALEQTAQALRINFAGYTSEVRYTDRVLRFPHMFGANGMYEEARPGIFIPDTHLLYSTVTGDPGDGIYFPTNAVRWKTPPRDIAALVTRATTDAFCAELVHFGSETRPMGAEMLLLKPGTYQVRVGDDAPRQVILKKDARQIRFTLPAHKTVVLEIKPV